jgi:hypothetical protein
MALGFAPVQLDYQENSQHLKVCAHDQMRIWQTR